MTILKMPDVKQFHKIPREAQLKKLNEHLNKEVYRNAVIMARGNLNLLNDLGSHHFPDIRDSRWNTVTHFTKHWEARQRSMRTVQKLVLMLLSDNCGFAAQELIDHLEDPKLPLIGCDFQEDTEITVIVFEPKLVLSMLATKRLHRYEKESLREKYENDILTAISERLGIDKSKLLDQKKREELEPFNEIQKRLILDPSKDIYLKVLGDDPSRYYFVDKWQEPDPLYARVMISKDSKNEILKRMGREQMEGKENIGLWSLHVPKKLAKKPRDCYIMISFWEEGKMDRNKLKYPNLASNSISHGFEASLGEHKDYKASSYLTVENKSRY